MQVDAAERVQHLVLARGSKTPCPKETVNTVSSTHGHRRKIHLVVSSVPHHDYLLTFPVIPTYLANRLTFFLAYLVACFLANLLTFYLAFLLMTATEKSLSYFE